MVLLPLDKSLPISKWWNIKDDLGGPAESCAGASGFGAKYLAVQQLSCREIITQQRCAEN